MSGDIGFYRDLAYVFGAAVVGGAAARALRQPMILGYVVGGILIGPFTPGPTLSDVHHFEVLAEIGVILLMYSIGLEFSFDDLVKVKWVALLGAPVGVVASVALGLGAGWLCGWDWHEGVAMGAIISVASTMVLSRLLEAHEMILTDAHDAAAKVADLGDDGTNDLIVSDIIRTGELQSWFLAEHLVDTPLVRA